MRLEFRGRGLWPGNRGPSPGTHAATRNASPVPQQGELAVPRACRAIELAPDLDRILVAAARQREETSRPGALQPPRLLLLLSHPAPHLLLGRARRDRRPQVFPPRPLKLQSPLAATSTWEQEERL